MDHGFGQVLVFGTGALGSLLAGRLAREPGVRVTLAGTWPEALSVARQQGVAVREPGRGWTVSRPSALAIGSALPRVRLAVVAVKSNQTLAVAPHVARSLTADGVALTLQNGLGNAEVLAAHVGPARVLHGVTSMGARLEGPGRVTAAGHGPTWIGDRPGAPVPAAEVAWLLTSAGMPAEVVRDLAAAVWRKLAVNCAINPVSALLGLANGRLLGRQDACLVMSGAAREVGQVARRLGIDLGADPALRAFEVARATAGNRSSMLRDVERGVPTEVDAINGAVVARGREVGVPTPVNEWLWRSVAGLAVGQPARFLADLWDSPVAGATRLMTASRMP